MGRKAWIAFAVVQLFAELGPWAGLRLRPSIGPAPGFAGIMVMIPGRLLGLWLTEKVLWGVCLTPVQMTAVFVVIEVAANVLAWLLCARVIRSLRRKRPVPRQHLKSALPSASVFQ